MNNCTSIKCVSEDPAKAATPLNVNGCQAKGFADASTNSKGVGVLASGAGAGVNGLGSGVGAGAGAGVTSTGAGDGGFEAVDSAVKGVEVTAAVSVVSTATGGPFSAVFSGGTATSVGCKTGGSIGLSADKGAGIKDADSETGSAAGVGTTSAAVGGGSGVATIDSATAGGQAVSTGATGSSAFQDSAGGSSARESETAAGLGSEGT